MRASHGAPLESGRCGRILRNDTTAVRCRHRTRGSLVTDSLHVVCGQCHTTNRVPRARLGDHANCGSCKAPLFAGHPIALDGASFERHVGSSDLPVAVDFWAPWCGPCRAMAPAWEQAAARLTPQVRLANLDTEAEPGIAQRFGIRSIPTIVLFRNGREVARQSGALSLPQILRWIEGNLGA
jgi:thioredoxin 2